MILKERTSSLLKIVFLPKVFYQDSPFPKIFFCTKTQLGFCILKTYKVNFNHKYP